MTTKIEGARLFEEINPPALGTPRGFNHGLVVEPSWRLLFVAGQTAATVTGDVADRTFVGQFTEALDKTLAVVRAAGGLPENIVRMTIYVTDIEAYRDSRPCLNAVWRERMGRHYPAMALVGVTELVDRDTTVEIETTAALPPLPR
jgi:enamine deaminase RidA (YjgF/YER057c/UK114 family)